MVEEVVVEAVVDGEEVVEAEAVEVGDVVVVVEDKLTSLLSSCGI